MSRLYSTQIYKHFIQFHCYIYEKKNVHCLVCLLFGGSGGIQNQASIANNRGANLLCKFATGTLCVHKIFQSIAFPPKRKARLVACVSFWRKRWDSNPRYREVQLISSQSRYDHFDTLPYCEREYYSIVLIKLQGLFEKNIFVFLLL